MHTSAIAAHGVLLADTSEVVIGLIELALALLTLIGVWKVFEKADKPGWASIVPIYNMIVLLRIADMPVWLVIAMFIPFVNVGVIIVIAINVARKFGKGIGYGLGLAFLPFIFYPLLGFSSD